MIGMKIIPHTESPISIKIAVNTNDEVKDATNVSIIDCSERVLRLLAKRKSKLSIRLSFANLAQIVPVIIPTNKIKINKKISLFFEIILNIFFFFCFKFDITFFSYTSSYGIETYRISKPIIG